MWFWLMLSLVLSFFLGKLQTKYHFLGGGWVGGGIIWLWAAYIYIYKPKKYLKSDLKTVSFLKLSAGKSYF